MVAGQGPFFCFFCVLQALPTLPSARMWPFLVLALLAERNA
jgi:hypothetical protein